MTDRYHPQPVPTDPKDIPRYLDNEMKRMAAYVNYLAEGHLQVYHVKPDKPRDGDIVLADGTDWNPNDPEDSTEYQGEGEGVYVYYNDRWNMLASKLGDLKDVYLGDVEDPLSVANNDAIISYNYNNLQWELEKIQDNVPRIPYANMLIMPGYQNMPTYTIPAVAPKPFYPYRPGWSADPPGWYFHGFERLEKTTGIWDPYKNWGHAFSFPTDEGRFLCHTNGDVLIQIHLDIGSDTNNTNVGVGIYRERAGVAQMFPIVATDHLPNIGDPGHFSLGCILPVSIGDYMGMAICADKTAELTFYNGQMLLSMMMEWE